MTKPGDGRPDLSSQPRDSLVSMREAANEVLTCQHALAKTGHSVITEMVGGTNAPIDDWQHYPAGDVYDAEHHAQFYFHVHARDERGKGELGHFHLFLRREGIPPEISPLTVATEGLCHLVAISLDGTGRPLRLFTTNRWVTGEDWYRAADAIALLSGFIVDHAQPSWPVNRWVSAMVRLYRPEICWLLEERDRALATASADRPAEEAFEDRSVEVLSSLDIDIADRIDCLDAALRYQRRVSSAGGP